jgi:hypothetical protein
VCVCVGGGVQDKHLMNSSREEDELCEHREIRSKERISKHDVGKPHDRRQLYHGIDHPIPDRFQCGARRRGRARIAASCTDALCC